MSPPSGGRRPPPFLLPAAAGFDPRFFGRLRRADGGWFSPMPPAQGSMKHGRGAHPEEPFLGVGPGGQRSRNIDRTETGRMNDEASQEPLRRLIPDLSRR